MEYKRLTTTSEITDSPTLIALCESCGEDGCDANCGEYQDNNCVGCPVQVAFERLSAYEDSGLSPEQVQEFAKAKVEGRLVALPNIPKNKTLYWLWGSEIMPVRYRGINGGCVDKSGAYHVTCNMITKKPRTFKHGKRDFTYPAGDKRMFYMEHIGKSVFFDRKAAVEAIKSGGDIP